MRRWLAQKIIEKATPYGKKVYETITKVKPTPTKTESAKVSTQKFKSSLKKFGTAITGGLSKTVKSLGQIEQKLSGKPVTKSGFSKGKDLPPPKKKK